MKSIIASFKNMQAFSFLVGMVWGSALGLILFCYMVPHGPRAIAMLRHYTIKMRGMEVVAERNRDAFRAVYSNKEAQMPTTDHSMHTVNPYMMNVVTSEKQFLEDMILHHDAAVTMAKQVLALPNTHQEVKTLADDIIRAQTSEIAKMKSWTVLWKLK